MIRFSTSEVFYTLTQADKFLEAEDWLYGNANGKLTDDPDKAYTSMNKESLQDMLVEYDRRLAGFRVVEVTFKETRSYKIKEI